jgi:hypothetical protein
VGADFLSRPAQWDKMVELVRAAGVCGFDTEFYNVDPSKQSCVGKARIHVWSIAIRTGQMGPRGFTLCRGWCLPAAALLHPPIKALLEDKSIRKMVHNQCVDQHSLLNHGIILRGGLNTLGYVKWKRPELINTVGRFKLKSLMMSLLGREPVCAFKDVVTDTRIVQVPRISKRKVKGCFCGLPKCRIRKTTYSTNDEGEQFAEPHTKETSIVHVTKMRDKVEEFEHALESIGPGHPRWDLLVEYSIEDSVAALQIAEVADDTSDPAPWPYVVRGPEHSVPSGLSRPGFSQAVELAIIRMEQVGFPRDKAFCIKQIEVANEDEEKVLTWLHKWYVVNSGTYGPHGRQLRLRKTPTGRLSVLSGSDGIWTSGVKKLALFDELGFPRSPIWAKGRVKEGKAKLDYAAMAWIAKNYAPSAQLISKLLLLGRIRSGRKYLLKLRDADDIVHPICGPAGDEDERSGAVTGRLGIKGELEAQQLPKTGEKDLYQVRRAIIA